MRTGDASLVVERIHVERAHNVCAHDVRPRVVRARGVDGALSDPVPS